MNELSFLVRPEWVRMQQLHPGLGDLDPLLLVLLVVGLEALAVGMDDQLGNLVGEDRMGHIPKILSLTLAPFWKRIRKIWL